jgi:hypothetical protein
LYGARAAIFFSRKRIKAGLDCIELSSSLSTIDAGHQIKAPLEAYRAELLWAVKLALERN